MIDRTGGPDAERQLGALMLAGAVLVAALIIAGKLLIGRTGAPPPTIAPTVVALTPLAPAVAPTAPPATPIVIPPATTPTAIAVAPTAPPVPAAPLAALQGAVVCLDPGHGGADLGNVRLEDGKVVLREKDFTLAHALEIGQRLAAQGVQVVYTRTGDTEANPTNADVNSDGEVAPEGGEAHSDELDDLQARVNACNAAGADLLVSIHYNGAENEFLQGYEVWYSDERPFSDRSARFATIIHSALGEQYAAAGYDAFDKGIGIEAHAVTGPARPGKLTPSEMPGAVVEGLFLSNADDAAFIQTPAATEAIVGAYVEAIDQYLQETRA
ncbi:MAG: N-acetylmuramoyl-L-alanine amidase [Thermomicrobiales bacterium]|nr:N-acetylmuramoyl-L-alanine amidase [Thermomicrobiales bacterium]